MERFFFRALTAIGNSKGWLYSGISVSEGYRHYGWDGVTKDSLWKGGIHFGHHSLAGDDDHDPEVKYLRKPLMWSELRTDLREPLLWYHKYQHIYAAPLAALQWSSTPIAFLSQHPLNILTVLKGITFSEGGPLEKGTEYSRLLFEVLFGSPGQSTVFLPIVGLLNLSVQRTVTMTFAIFVLTSVSPANLHWFASLMHWIKSNDPYDRSWNDRNSTTWFSRAMKNSVDISLISKGHTCSQSWDSYIWFWLNDWCTLGGYTHQAVHHVAPALSPAYYMNAKCVLKEVEEKFHSKYNDMNFVQASVERISFLQDLSGV